MITPNQLLAGILMGTILIVMGLVPGLLDRWADAVSDFAGTLFYRIHGIPLRRRERASFGEQRWIATLGMSVIALAFYLYVSR